MNILQRLTDHHLCTPHAWMATNVHYLATIGSASYGVATDLSDKDIGGICIPPKYLLFPQHSGKLFGFDWPSEKAYNKTTNWQKHHIKDEREKFTYDFKIYSIIRFFKLALGCNPDVIDMLFVNRECILHTTEVGEIIRENRHMFLSKLGWNTFKGYAYSQLKRYRYVKNKNAYIKRVIEFEKKHGLPHTMTLDEISKEIVERGDGYSKNYTSYKLIVLNYNNLEEYHSIMTVMVEDSKRNQLIKSQGMDTKGMYHVVRLLNEIEQILSTHDLDIRVNREQLKSIRRGEWTQEQIVDYADKKERELENLKIKSTLPELPDIDKIKQVLFSCLESHYGSLGDTVSNIDKQEQSLREIIEISQRALAN